MNAVASAVCGLVFVLGLIFFMNWLLRRFGGALCARTGRKSEIVLLDVKALDAKNKLVLARCRGKEFLLMTGESNETVATFDAIDDNRPETVREENA